MWRSICLLVIAVTVTNCAVVPRYPPQLKYDTKTVLDHPNDLKPHPKPLSYPSYPWFYPYHAPYYFPSLPYYPMPYYQHQQQQQKVVLDKDAKQGNFKIPAYDFKGVNYDFKAPQFNQFNYKAPTYDFKVHEDGKSNFKLPPFAYPPFPLNQNFQKAYHQDKAPVQAPVPAPAPAPEPKQPVIHQQYKEVEMLPEVHEVPPVEHEEQQIVHKDEPAYSSFIFIGKYKGSCEGDQDGLYYVDKKTFAYCVDQREVFQPCAEGTENPEKEEFINGKLQYSHHFCSINLLAQNPEPVPTHADPHYNTYQYEEVPEEKY